MPQNASRFTTSIYSKFTLTTLTMSDTSATARTDQEKFDEKLEDYFDSDTGKAYLAELITEFLKTDEGVAVVRNAISSDDNSGTTITTTATGTASVAAASQAAASSSVGPSPKKPRANPVVSHSAKWDSLLADATANWNYEAIQTVRRRGPKQVIHITAKYINVELEKWIALALELVNQARFASLEEANYVKIYLLGALVRRMRCNFRFDAALKVIDMINASHTPVSTETRAQVLSLTSEFRGRSVTGQAASAAASVDV